MTVDVCVRVGGQVQWSDWALNEAALEKEQRGRMVECVLEIEGRPLSRWACDGVVCATPTVRPHTRSAPAGRSSGRTSRHCCRAHQRPRALRPAHGGGAAVRRSRWRSCRAPVTPW